MSKHTDNFIRIVFLGAGTLLLISALSSGQALLTIGGIFIFLAILYSVCDMWEW